MPKMRRRIAAACVASALAAAPASAERPDPNARYKELVAAYAAGNRAAAVAGIGDLDADALRSGVESVREYAPRLLLAVLMLHTDRRLLERGAPDAIETTPACDSVQTDPAWRTLQHLMLHVDGVDFARRWSVAMALQDHWDGCFVDALRWIDVGARWFPKDAEVLLTRGALYESVAALPSPMPRPANLVSSRKRGAVMMAAAERANHLGEARRSLERAIGVAPALDEARLRLGRVLWRLGKGDAARAALETVIAGNPEAATLHLARLFLARVHQDAGRDDDALREYRAALALQPESQAAAIGLADALQIAGLADDARTTVEGTLAEAGRRREAQAFWEYTFANARQGSAMLERLRDELTP
jgi:tetratricopeptide (TPR) repeat protein